MNKIRRIVFVVVGIVLAGASLLYLFYYSSKTKLPQKTIYPIAAPEIPSNFNGTKSSFTFSPDLTQIEIPQTLPFMNVGRPKSISEEKVVEMAKSAGFSDVFTKIINGEGRRLYFFKDKSSDIIIYADTGEISYRTAFRTYKSAGLDDASITNAAKEFLIKKFSFDKDRLQSPFVTYLSTDSELTKVTDYKNATMYKVSFSPVQTSYKLLTINPKESPINVWVVPDGTIAKADVTLFEKATFSTESHQTKTLEEIKNSISKATVMQVNDDAGSSLNLRIQDIKNIEITKIEIVYIADSYNSQKYQPFFLLEGSSTIQGYNKPLNAVLYLSAFK